MQKITKDELVDKLNSSKNKIIELDLEGIISTSLKVNFDKIIKTEDDICILDKENEKNIKFNLHQIMKIDDISDSEIIIYFDGLQTVNIKLK